MSLYYNLEILFFQIEKEIWWKQDVQYRAVLFKKNNLLFFMFNPKDGYIFA